MISSRFSEKHSWCRGIALIINNFITLHSIYFFCCAILILITLRYNVSFREVYENILFVTLLLSSCWTVIKFTDVSDRLLFIFHCV